MEISFESCVCVLRNTKKLISQRSTGGARRAEARGARSSFAPEEGRQALGHGGSLKHAHPERWSRKPKAEKLSAWPQKELPVSQELRPRSCDGYGEHSAQAFPQKKRGGARESEEVSLGDRGSEAALLHDTRNRSRRALPVCKDRGLRSRGAHMQGGRPR